MRVVFGGLIAHRGSVAAVREEHGGGVRLEILAPSAVAEGIVAKDSIAIDGVCLTVAICAGDTLSFDVVPETLARSTLGDLVTGSPVNVELSLRLGERIGGHLVYGHVDATARILTRTPEGQGYRLSVGTPDSLRSGIVEKGYVAVDGVSLTVATVRDDRFQIVLIPETCARTSLGDKHAGDRVNLELDPLARYVLVASRTYRGAS